MTARRPAPWILLAWILAVASASGLGAVDDEVFESETWGFRIRRPDRTFVLHESGGDSRATFSLTMVGSGDTRITVLVKPVSGTIDAVAVRDATVRWLESQPEGYDHELADFEVAQRTAPGLIVDMPAPDGRRMRVQQFYLVERGLQYTLAATAPADGFEDHARTFARAWRSFKLTPLSEEMRAEQTLRALAARCGSEIDWVPSWDEAAARARREGKLVLVLARFLPGFEISDDASFGPFMDPDVVELVRERFVALRLTKEMDAPFRSQESYGISPSTFGTSILLVTPGGEVVGDGAILEPAPVYELLRETLARHPDFPGAPVPEIKDRLDLAQLHLRRGELKLAAPLLEDASTARCHWLRASLLRRLRQGEAALSEIEKARAAGASGMEADLDLDEALILVRMGRLDSASEALRRFLERHGESERLPEALYWRGACEHRLRGAKEAETWWRRLALGHPESRWAWKAAGALQSTAFAIGRGERIEWPEEDVLDALRPRELRTLDAFEARRAEQDAIAYLLRVQRADGSWISPTVAGRFRPEDPDEFSEAITAICAQSLLGVRDDPEAAGAVRRAIGYLREARARAKAAGETPFFMDYTVWSKAYGIWLLADCVEAGVVDRDGVREWMEEFVSELRAKQKAGGGWSYYVTHDLRTASTPSNQSISFVTAAVVLALLRAREVAIAVPEAMLDGALGCLERMRNANGTFEYMLVHDAEDRPRRTGQAGAAGRGPLCELALHRAGRGSVDRIRAALDTFLAWRHTYAREHGKSLMHAGADGQGSHYLMFDYTMAAAAIAELPEEERGAYREKLLEQILGARTSEGSSIDNPILGRAYGTGMALGAFQKLGVGGGGGHR